MRRLIIPTICLSLFAVFMPVRAAVFTDVSSDHPNYNAINYLYDEGVIEGYQDNTFRPDVRVNRVEALKIILLGSDVLVPNIQAQEIFPDVMYDAWYGKYAAKAKNLGIVKGDDTTGYFRPGDTVNLAEALKILLKTNEINPSSPSSNPYWDVSSDAWFSPYFDYARRAGLLDQSSNENVYPATPVTRGLLAELMYRLNNSSYIEADGTASYYGEKFHGKTTASGEIFDASAFTAAHLTYPFGTWLKVTNVANGESVVVRVNDRGPYVSDPDRIIDLSKAAFESISPLSRGIISVKVEPTYAPSSTDTTDSTETTDTTETSKPKIPTSNTSEGDMLNPTKSSCPDAYSIGYLKKTTFSNITLDNEIPTRFVLDEVLTLTGTTSSNADTVSAFIVDSEDNQYAFYGDVTGDRFTVNVRFPDEGTYDLGVLPGESGSSIIAQIKVLKNTCIEEVESSGLTAVSGLDLSIVDGETEVAWNEDGYDIYKLTFSQGGLHKSYILHGIYNWNPLPKEFKDFIAGDTSLSLRGGNLTEKSLVAPAQIVWSPPSTKNFIASEHHEYNVDKDEVTLVSLSSNTIIGGTIKAIFKPKVSVRSKAAVILPSGKVEEVTLTSPNLSSGENAFGIDVFPSSSESLTLSYKAQTTGIHFVEINNAEGLAVINVPIYIKNQYPLLPNTRDLHSQMTEDLGSDLTLIRNNMLQLVNDDRSDQGLSPLAIDSKLNNLAQYRSDDMVQNKYFSHWDYQGNDANDLRLNYGIQTLVGENLAKDINVELAQYGLMRSAIHRSNILSEDWTRMGIGISKLEDGSYIFVQIFSEDALDMSDLNGLRNSLLDKINDGRSSDFTLQSNLNNIAQSWSEKMTSEDFFDFTDGSGDTLVDSIRSSGVNDALGTYIMGNSSFADALDQAADNAQLKDGKWSDLGIGIKQDSVGIIKITLIYTE